MGLVSVILSLCCLAEDPDDSAVGYPITPAPVIYITPEQYSATKRVSTTTILNEFGTPGDILTPKQLMLQLYGGTGSIRNPLTNLSIRQPGHPCFIPPRIMVTPPAVRGNVTSLSRMMGFEQDESYLKAPPRPEKMRARQRSRASYAGLGRTHVGEVQF